MRTKRKGMGSHQSQRMGKDEWLTPPHIMKAIGKIDLDPCSPIVRPWEYASNHYTIEDNGLSKSWEGRVYCNPPYGNQTKYWLEKCAKHKNATALIFARTETKFFFEEVWEKANSVLFIKGRLFFHHVTGERAKSNSGAPSVLVAYDHHNTTLLKNSGIEGKLVVL